MSRRLRSNYAFPLTVLFTLVLALLPARWLAWTNDVAGIVHLPLTPFGDAGVRLAGWLRPAPALRTAIHEDTVEQIRHVTADRDRFERLYRSAQLRIQQLTEELSQLQQLPPEVLAGTAPPKIARITGRNLAAAAGAVELKGGSHDGHEVGMVGVYNSVFLIGRVSSVSRFRSVLTPITHGANGLMIAVVVPADRPEAPLTTAPRIQLIPQDDGTFAAEADRSHDLREGDIVRLDDPSWPPWAQAMVVGTIEAVSVKDAEPLRHDLVIRPRFQVSDVAYVSLLTGADELAQGGDGRGES
jgi:hypothetical protein